MIFDAVDFAIDKCGEYVAEASLIGLKPGQVLESFTLKNCPKEGQHRSFKRVRADVHGLTVAGWWYEEVAGPNCGRDWSQGHPPREVPVLKALIIND